MNLSEATSARFRHSTIMDGISYRTGDLVRLLAEDESFDFVGRVDNQIKLRGQRIETGEIDAVICRASHELSSAVTLVLSHITHKKEQLVSFVSVVPPSGHSSVELNTLEDRGQLVAESFRAARKSLPVYMVPTYIIMVNYIPLTPTNKVILFKLLMRFH